MSIHFSPTLKHDSDLHPSGSRKVGFSPEFYRMVSRSRVEASEIEIATEAEVRSALLLARSTLTLVDDDVAMGVYAHHPQCFRIIRRADISTSPFMAYLPLNASGVTAMVEGRFDGLRPDLSVICKPGEIPEAIYSWLTYTPNEMVIGLRLLLELEHLGHGSPIFTRAANAVAYKILRRSGFRTARELFTSSPEWLLIALSVDSGTSALPGKGPIQVRVVRTMEDMAKIYVIRTATYMCEQLCTYDEEFDGNDFAGTHLIGELNGEPAGCVRIRYFGTFAKLERLAVRPEYRRSRLMWRLVRAAFAHCQRKGFTKLYAHARHDLVPAWERFGARPIKGRPPFFFSDVKFQEMELDLPQHAQTISFGADPLVTIRPEGEWDLLGPIEKAQFTQRDERRRKVAELTRSDV